MKLCFNYIALELVGSRVTCLPAPTNTDQDVLVLVYRYAWEETYDALYKDGWQLEGSHVTNERSVLPTSDFCSYRKNDINLIITDEPVFYQKFLAATSVAKKLNLQAKADRVDLFQAVLYGNKCAHV